LLPLASAYYSDISARRAKPHHGLLPAVRSSHSACPNLLQELAQCFTLVEPGHNSSAASHIVRTTLRTETLQTGIRTAVEGK
jgi:hypothetical protein